MPFVKKELMSAADNSVSLSFARHASLCAYPYDIVKVFVQSRGSEALFRSKRQPLPTWGRLRRLAVYCSFSLADELFISKKEDGTWNVTPTK